MRFSQNNERVLNKFLRYLNRNKMGQSFFRYVSSSLERTPKSRGISQRRYDTIHEKHREKDRMYTQPSKKKIDIQPNQTVTSFNINESPLGHSIKLMDTVAPHPVINNHMLRSRQTTFRDRMQMSKLNTFSTDKHSLQAQHFFRSREQLLKRNQIDVILTTLTGNPNVNKLRIYKDKMKKFYNARYGKQKLTIFFDYQYIQDISTQLQYLQTLLSLNLQEIHFLCFILFDGNSDGLVCNDDLFNIATVSADENPLINKDIFKIFHYVSMYQNPRTSVTIMDTPADDDPAKDPTINLQKYKLAQLKSQKQGLLQSEKKQLKSSVKKSLRISTKPEHKGIVLSRKVNKHLFSLKTQQEQGEVAIKQLRKRFAEYTLQTKSCFKFKINFQRYSNIFKNTIPQTFYDILFAQGGIKIQGKSYCPLNFDFETIEKKEVIKQDVDHFKHFEKTLSKMRQTFRKSRIQKFNDPRKRIYRSY